MTLVIFRRNGDVTLMREYPAAARLAKPHQPGHTILARRNFLPSPADNIVCFSTESFRSCGQHVARAVKPSFPKPAPSAEAAISR
jgi:hypothetical protein